MDLLVKFKTDFLNMYDSLANTTDHWERVAKRSTELGNEVGRLRERNKILFMDYQTLLAKYKTVLEILEERNRNETLNNSNDNNKSVSCESNIDRQETESRSEIE